VKKLLKEYWIELVGLAVLFLAVYLLLNRHKLGAMRRASQGVVGTISGYFGNLYNNFSNYFARMSALEILAWILAIGGMAFILWRIRFRFLKSDRWQVLACPRCGSNLHRVHRTSLDHLIGPIFLPRSARYRCSNSECRWSGLRQTRQGSAAALQSQNTPGDQV
jgi:hypothetical protein